jgi:hypothetical protein
MTIEMGAPYTEPGRPWENGYCESFSGKLLDECLNGEILYSVEETPIVIEKWRVEYKQSGLRPPAPVGCSPLTPPNASSQALCDLRSLIRRGAKIGLVSPVPEVHFQLRRSLLGPITMQYMWEYVGTEWKTVASCPHDEC